MRNLFKLALAGAGLAGGAVLAARAADTRWNAETAREIERLRGSAGAGEPPRVSFARFDELPAPVARYFRFALRENAPLIRAARVAHAGDFNLDGRWIPFTSEQYFTARPPGFVWDARMRMNGLLPVRVRDGYFGGQGSMTAKILGLFPVANAGGADERLAQGALMRFLAEAVWLPTALLPRDGLHWSPIDDARARATLADAGVTVALDFTFDEAGAVTGIFAPARYREMNGEYRAYPWTGRFWHYEDCGGFRIPTAGEVAWQMPEGPLPYWRGRVAAAFYET